MHEAIAADLFDNSKFARPRPRKHDKIILEEAKVRFIEHAAKHPNFTAECDGDPEAFATDLARYYQTNHDGRALARELEKRAYYEADETLDDIAQKFIDLVETTHRDAIRTWISQTGQKCPFEQIARVIAKTTRFNMAGPGLAYKSRHYENQGQCLFIPDENPDKHIQNGLLRGGYVIDWEDIESVAAATDADRRIYDATNADARRVELESRLSRHLNAAKTSHSDLVGNARKTIASLTNDELKIHVAALLSELSRSPFQPESKEIAELEAALALWRVRNARHSFNPDAIQGDQS